MNDEPKMEIIEAPSSFLTSTRRRGLEWVGTGASTFALAWLIPKFAFLAVGAYGIYRMAVTKSWIEGIVWLTLAVATYGLMPFLFPIFWLVKLAGVALAAVGLALIFKPNKENK